MKKKAHFPLRWLLLLPILAILFILAVLLLPFPFHSGGGSYTDYGSWMSETVAYDVRIVDVAMPGAHDSLSYEIDFFSEVDETSITSPLDLAILRGLAVRQSKTQILTAGEQLESGVRYLDIRVTYDESDQNWYGVHNFKSVLLSEALSEIYDFLMSHPGEVVILDFQHCYDSREEGGTAGTTGTEDLYALLTDSGLTGFMKDVSLSTVTYGELTDNGTHAAALVLMKETGGHADILQYENSILSVWYDTDDTEAVFAGLNLTARRVQNSVSLQNRFRVQQNVLTMQATASGVIKGIRSWSLLRRADSFNAAWLEAYMTDSAGSESDWLADMPIVMMDDAGVGENAEQLMELILTYNKTLSGEDDSR